MVAIERELTDLCGLTYYLRPVRSERAGSHDFVFKAGEGTDHTSDLISQAGTFHIIKWEEELDPGQCQPSLTIQVSFGCILRGQKNFDVYSI
jgi:hypothetical protein